MSDNVTEKTITIAPSINFEACGLPTEVTQTTIENVTGKEKVLRSCDKLIVKYTRVNTKLVYGFGAKNSKDRIEPNKEYIGNVEKFLKAMYETGKENSETFQEYVYRTAFQVRNGSTLLTQAKKDAIDLENANIDTKIAEIETLADSGQMDIEACMKLMAKLQAKIAASKTPETNDDTNEEQE